LLERIRRDLVRTILKTLKDLLEDDYDHYVTYFKEMGEILKEGIHQDWNNREKIADLLLYGSLKTPRDQFTTLNKYFSSMSLEQPAIYFLLGEDREQLEHSPYLEAARAREYDVLLGTDPIDELVLPALGEYHGKPLRALDREGLEAPKK